MQAGCSGIDSFQREAAAVVVHGNPQVAAVQPDPDLAVTRTGMPGHILQRLGAAEVDRDLDVCRIAIRFA
jgi:hypothetical protein